MKASMIALKARQWYCSVMTSQLSNRKFAYAVSARVEVYSLLCCCCL